MGTTNSMLGCNPAEEIQLQALWPAWPIKAHVTLQ